MAKLNKVNGVTSVVLRVKIMDTSSSSGAGKTGLTEASAGMIIGTISDNEAATTRYRASSSEIETITTLGTYQAPSSNKCRFKEVDAVNHPGVYEIHLADARWAVSGAKEVIITVQGASGAAQVDAEVQLDLVNVNVANWKGSTAPALVSGRIDASVGAMAANVMTAAAAASDLTTELQSGLATAAAVSTLQTSVDDLPTNSELATALASADDAVLAAVATRASQTSVDDLPTNSELATALASADDAALAQIALVKAKTDNLPSDPADQSLIISATDALLTAIGDLPTNSELTTALASADDAVLAAIDTRASQTSIDALDLDDLAAILAYAERTVIRATVGSGSSGTSIVTSAIDVAAASADQFKGRVVLFDKGTATAALRGQGAIISASSNATLSVLTVSALTAVPASGDTFSIV